MKNGEAREGKFIAVANMKGGVGKTTTVVSLAEALAADDTRPSVLVIDLDPQASASICLAGDKELATLIRGGRTLEAFLALRMIKREKTELQTKIRTHISLTERNGEQLQISLLPCGPHLRIVEREITHVLTQRKFSMNAIEGQLWLLFEKEILPLAKIFDFVIFDCAPGISPLTEVAICGSDLVVVPSIPDFLSTFGLNAFCRSIWTYRSGGLPPPKQLPYVLATRCQGNVRQHQDTLVSLRAEAGASNPHFKMFRTLVPQSAALQRALATEQVQTFANKYGLLVSDVLSPLVTEIRRAF